MKRAQQPCRKLQASRVFGACAGGIDTAPRRRMPTKDSKDSASTARRGSVPRFASLAPPTPRSTASAPAQRPPPQPTPSRPAAAPRSPSEPKQRPSLLKPTPRPRLRAAATAGGRRRKQTVGQGLDSWHPGRGLAGAAVRTGIAAARR